MEERKEGRKEERKKGKKVERNEGTKDGRAKGMDTWTKQERNNAEEQRKEPRKENTPVWKGKGAIFTSIRCRKSVPPEGRTPAFVQ
jgi:hypothetical protein